MNRLDYHSPMVRQAVETPTMLAPIMEASFTDEALRAALPADPSSIKQVILSGCGDSFASGAATYPAFAQLCQLPAQGISALYCGRYTTPAELDGALVILNSISGGVSRVVESARHAKAHGAFTVALTGDPESPLGKECDSVLQLKDMPYMPGTPKVIAYTASCVGQFYLAAKLAQAQGKIDDEEYQDIRHALYRYGTSDLAEVIDEIDETVFGCMDKWAKFDRYTMLGDGGDYGAALFSGFKYPESVGRMANWDDTENFNHVGYFHRELDKIGTAMAISADSPTLQRAVKTAETLCQLGRMVVIATDADRELFPKEAVVCTMPKASYPWMAAGFLHIPLSLLASYPHALEPDMLAPYRKKQGVWDNANISRLQDSHIEVL